MTLSEYLEEPEKISRARNLIATQEGGLFYYQQWGVNKQIMTGLSSQLMESSVVSYLRQVAFTNGIVLSETDRADADFITSVTMKVEG